VILTGGEWPHCDNEAKADPVTAANGGKPPRLSSNVGQAQKSRLAAN
jgi:hypothetical protein